MPRKPPPEHTRFQKGVSGNPGGRLPEPPELKAIKNLTKQELVSIGNMIVKGDVAALRQIAKDDKSSVIKVMVASVAVKVISKGDMHALDVLLNRLIGKVKEEVDMHVETQAKVVLTLPSNGKEAPQYLPKNDKDNGSDKN